MDTVVRRYKPAPGALDNPLKGWCTYSDADLFLPYSMVFRYVSWRELEPREGEYAFDKWERTAWDNDPKAKNKHIVFRVYLDYPGLPLGVPDWVKASGVKMTPYSTNELEGYAPGAAKGESPDYANLLLVAALEKLIAALGKRYDTDPRVAFIQIGLLGFWGEWHTWPSEKLFAPDATQKRVVDAYKKAFPHKKLMARYATGYVGQQAWMGFHDDYFPDDTGTEKDYYFLRGMTQAGRTENYRAAPVGGEMVPHAADKWVGTDAGYARTKAMIRAAHFSWVGPYSPAMERRAGTDAAFRARCAELVRLMGYDFRLAELVLPATIRRGEPFALTLHGVNLGVAPFYYPWKVALALLAPDDTACEIAVLARTDIRAWQPGAFSITDTARFAANPAGLRLAVGILDPHTNLPAIRFANTIAITRSGWHVLTPANR